MLKSIGSTKPSVNWINWTISSSVVFGGRFLWKVGKKTDRLLNGTVLFLDLHCTNDVVGPLVAHSCNITHRHCRIIELRQRCVIGVHIDSRWIGLVAHPEHLNQNIGENEWNQHDNEPGNSWTATSLWIDDVLHSVHRSAAGKFNESRLKSLPEEAGACRWMYCGVGCN